MESSTPDPGLQYGQVNPSLIERLPYEGPPTMKDWPEIRANGIYPNRTRGIGSSDAQAIARIDGYKYGNPYSLYLVKRGEIPKPSTAFPEVAEVGLLLEPVIAQLYARKKHRKLIDRGIWEKGQRWDVRRHAEIPWMIANLDMEVTEPSGRGALAFAASGNGVAEWKSKDPWGDIFDDDGNLLTEIQVQVQHQLAVAGLEWASVGALVGRRFYCVDFRRHDDFIAWLISEETEFVERCMNGDPPEIDDHQATGNAIAEKYPVEQKRTEIELSSGLAELLPEWQQVRADFKVAAARQEEIENKLKFAIGDAEEGWSRDRRYGFSWKKTKDSLDKYVIKTKGRLEEIDEQVIEELGGEFQPGKKGARRFTVKREPKDD